MNIQEGYDAASFVGPAINTISYLEDNNKNNETATPFQHQPVNPIKYRRHLYLQHVLFFVARKQETDIFR